MDYAAADFVHFIINAGSNKICVSRAAVYLIMACDMHRKRLLELLLNATEYQYIVCLMEEQYFRSEPLRVPA